MKRWCIKDQEQVRGSLASENVFVSSEASPYYSVHPETLKNNFN